MAALFDGTTPVVICDACGTKVTGGRATHFLLRLQLSRLGWSFFLPGVGTAVDHCAQCSFESMYAADPKRKKGGD